jgi:hypothetical protein
MFEVPATEAPRSVASVTEDTPSWRAVVDRTIPDVATSFSVARFGAIGVVAATACDSISTEAVEVYRTGMLELIR